MQLGIALALVCAAITQLGFLCKHRGAGCAPKVELTPTMKLRRKPIAEKYAAEIDALYT